MKTENFIVKSTIYTITLSFVFLVLPIQAGAEGLSLKVSPTQFRIKALPPTDIRAPFTIENQSESPVSLKIGYKIFDKENSKDGRVVFFKKNEVGPVQEQKIFQQMQVVDGDDISYNAIELGPKQKKQLQLRIILPKNQPTADHVFSLVFLEKPSQTNQIESNKSIQDQRSTTSLLTGIGFNVLLSIGPKATPMGNIDTFDTPWLRQGGPVPFTLKVNNNGTHYITPFGTIYIKNMFGQTVGKIVLPKSVILAGTGRTMTSTTSHTYANFPPNSKVNDFHRITPPIVWPEKILFGLYSADLELSLSDEGPVSTRTIHFLAFPVIIVAEILTVIALAIVIYLRIKRKISKR